MRIVLHRGFEKRLTKLSPKIRRAWEARRDLFRKDPFDSQLKNHALHGEFAQYRSIDVTGDYRALYEATDSETAFFIMIDTHTKLFD